MIILTLLILAILGIVIMTIAAAPVALICFGDLIVAILVITWIIKAIRKGK